ncbi:MAG: EAL domain-containing protein [Rhodoferax sp.]|nr:EAL domain-containing protein [Rhodoferax sp.]
MNTCDDLNLDGATPQFDQSAVAALARENAALRLKLVQLEEAARAIRGDEVDALFVTGSRGTRLFTLDGADRAYRLLIEEMGEGALTLTREGIVLYANRHFAQFLGRPLAQVIGSRVQDAFAPEGRASLSALLTQQLGKRSAELDLLTQAGRRVPTLVSVSGLAIEGLPGALCMVATDLTWQRRSKVASQARQALLQLVENQQRTEESLQSSLATLRLRDSALGAISQGVLIADAPGNTTYANRACEEMTGYSASEMAGRTAGMLQGPSTSLEARQALKAAIAAALPFHGELLNYRKDGTTFWNELSVTPVFDPQGNLTQSVGVMRDVTARRQADAQLLLASKMFEQSGEGFMVTDAQRKIVKVNQAFTTICGFSEQEALGQNLSMLASGRHEPEFFENLWRAIAVSGRWQGEIWSRRKDGSVYPQWLSMTGVVDSQGQTTHYIGAFSDITQRKADEDNIRRLAHFDPLTGLANRALLSDRASHALRMARRGNQPLALMFIDLDHFKNVNDSLGHDIGDHLLVALAVRFKSALRDEDTLSRTGGDEFVLLLPGTDAAGAAHVAQKLVQLTQAPHQIERHELTITPSIGIALFPVDGGDFDTLAKCADAAMYRAKQGGRNCFRFYTAEIQAQSARALLLENALRRAIERGQMQLHYQPQTSLRRGNITGVEALLRWQHPELGWVSPAEFIPIAESSGLITSIGEWVLRTAMQQMKVWLDAGINPISVAVNLSTVQFRQQNLPELVSRILEDAGVPPECLELELTESVAADDPDGAVVVMNRLRAHGVRMSIDDFGTGYSSLSYLKRFKVYKLKIDQSFVRGLMDDPEDRAIVAAIINLASSLGLQTIAEGVETKEQVEYLRQAGCDEIQGYWLSRPLAAAQLEVFIHSRGRALVTGGNCDGL